MTLKQHILNNWLWFGLAISNALIGGLSWSAGYLAIFTALCWVDQREYDQRKIDDSEHIRNVESINEKWANRGIDFDIYGRAR